jgi:hypothetical protein
MSMSISGRRLRGTSWTSSKVPEQMESTRLRGSSVCRASITHNVQSVMLDYERQEWTDKDDSLWAWGRAAGNTCILVKSFSMYSKTPISLHEFHVVETSLQRCKSNLRPFSPFG